MNRPPSNSPAGRRWRKAHPIPEATKARLAELGRAEAKARRPLDEAQAAVDLALKRVGRAKSKTALVRASAAYNRAVLNMIEVSEKHRAAHNAAAWALADATRAAVEARGQEVVE